MDSFKIRMAISNVGKNTSENFKIQITRTFPNGSKQDTLFEVPYITYRDTIDLKLPLDFQIGSGIN